MSTNPAIQRSAVYCGANSSHLDFLRGGGEMGERIRRKDWAKTSLGPPETWPQSLRVAIRIMLASRQPVWIGWGAQFLYFYNDSYKSIVGGRHPAALGLPARQVWPETWSQIGPMLDAALGGDLGTYVESHLLIMERNGYPEETYYTWSYTPIPDDDGRPGGIYCANTDDTQRVIGERQLTLLRELASQAARGRTMQEVCDQCVGALTTNRRDLPFALIYLPDGGGSALRLRGASGISNEHPAAPAEVATDSPSCPWSIDQVAATRELQIVAVASSSVGAPVPTGDWKEPPTRAAVVPIGMPGLSDRCGALVVGLNRFRLLDESYRTFLSMVAGQISAGLANAEAHDQQRRRTESLAALDQAKTAFFSNVSHEFRTPLTLMLGPLEEALDEQRAGGLSPTQRERIKTAHRNSLRLLKLVNSLLDFSLIEADRTVATYQPTDLSAFTAELASVFRSVAEQARLFLQIDCSPLSGPVYVDPDMWEKIVLNLVSNAFKFTFTGGIRVAIRELGSHVELIVRDTGVGIPASERSNIFKRFYRVRGSRSRTYEGTGIGLALVQDLVRIHGGDICVHSVERQGSMFRVRLPFGTTHLPSDRITDTAGRIGISQPAAGFLEESTLWIRNTSVPPASERDTSESKRDLVLVADDNADLRAYVSRLIGREFDVISAGDGLAALAASVDRQPDLVLADVMMPELDGFGLMSQLRAHPKTSSIPIILLSARAGEEARIEGLDRGADDYLVKPFTANELIARVRSHITLARERAAKYALQQSNRDLAQLVEQRTAGLALMHDVTKIINEAPSWHEALRSILQRTCRALGWQAGYIYLPDPNDAGVLRTIVSYLAAEHLQEFHAACQQGRFSGGEDIPGRVYVEGTAQWRTGEGARLAMSSFRRRPAEACGIDSALAQPLKSAADTIGVLELISQGERAPEDMLARLISDVADQIGKLLERERIATQMADLVWREQQELLHTLHDSLGQTLTSLGMLSAGLSRRTAGADPLTAELATHITGQAKVALEQVRQLSRGLFPIEVDAQGLPFALRELGSTTEKFHGVRVQYTEQLDTPFFDARVATQLYRVAQEAVTNAAKHARARSILIELKADGIGTRLCVRDDGIGPPKPTTTENGLGLHIMRYRARSIGAQLSIEGAPGGGTLVRCTVLQT